MVNKNSYFVMLLISAVLSAVSLTAPWFCFRLLHVFNSVRFIASFILLNFQCTVCSNIHQTCKLFFHFHLEPTLF